MNVKVKISALLLCAALLFDTVGAAAATGFEDKRLEVVAGMTAGVSADIPNGMKITARGLYGFHPRQIRSLTALIRASS